MAGACLAESASAIDSNPAVSQYVRYFWGSDKGFPGGTVYAFAQTPDGYLWIGTDKGLIRFDGLAFQKFEPASPFSFQIGPVRKLMTDAYGNLWVLLQSTKLLRYKGGQFELIHGEAENGITAIGQNTRGAVLLSSLAIGTLSYDGERFATLLSPPAFADSPSLRAPGNPDELSSRLSWSSGHEPHGLAAPDDAVISMAGTTDGRIWLGTHDKGLFYLTAGRVSAANGLTNSQINCLLPAERADLWIGTSTGVVRWNGAELTHDSVARSLFNADVLSMIRDRDSNIWVGTTRGLVRFDTHSASAPSKDLPESGAEVTALFEDREGNIWTGGQRGIERLRDNGFVNFSVPGLRPQSMGPVYVDPNGYTWFAPIDGGLRWLKAEKGGAVTAGELTHDVVYSISGRGKDLWLG